VKIDRQRFVHSYEYAKGMFGYSSASLLQSLTTASMLGVVAALFAVGIGATMYYEHVRWYINVGTILGVETLVTICLATITLEQARRRSIRRTLEFAFLNHHVHNALTQIIMASNVTDIGKHDRYMQEAVGRISETLFRVGKQSGLAGLSLDVDLAGTDLNRGREEREKQWKARGA
jgi:hypothetical protein